MAKAKKATEEKFEKTEFNLFEALTALDKKDYGYYDRLTDEQKKGFSPYMLVQYLCSVKGSRDLQSYYLQSVEYHANKYLLDNILTKKDNPHPKLQWLMLCASSPGLSSQFHPWIPQIKEKITKLKEPAKLKDIKEYYKKIYSRASEDDIEQLASEYVNQHERKVYFATKYPELSLNDIETLSKIVTDDEIIQYEQESGNI